MGLFTLFAALNKATHTLSGAVDLSLYRTHWHTHLLGNLLVGVVLKKTHREDFAVLFGQTVDVVLYLVALLKADKVLLWRGGAGYGSRELLVNGNILLSAAFKVDVGVARNGVNPLAEGVLRAVTLQIYIHLDEGLLQQILRILNGCGAVEQKPSYGVAVTVEQILKGGMVARE